MTSEKLNPEPFEIERDAIVKSVSGDVTVRHLDLAAILKDPRQKTDLTGDAHVNLHGEALWQALRPAVAQLRRRV